MSVTTWALQYIPTNWPLQQLIATNPLWDLTKDAMADTCQTLDQWLPTKTTLPLTEFCHLYQTGEITPTALKQACEQYVTSDATALFNWLTNKPAQRKLNKSVKQEQENKQQLVRLLIAKQVGPYSYDKALEHIKKESFTWLATFFHDKKRDSESFLTYWLERIKTQNSWRSITATYKQDPQKALETFKQQLGIPTEIWNYYVLAILWQVKGWVGFVKWQQQYPSNPYLIQNFDPEEIIIFWLMHELHWLQQHQSDLADFQPSFFNPAVVKQMNTVFEQLTSHDVHWLWQHAYELSYQQKLTQKLVSVKPTKSATATPPKAQWLFCIDVRSAAARRHLEQQTGFETFGIAGFFGLVFQLCNPAQGQATNQCPGLVEPDLVIDTQQKAQGLYQQLQANVRHSIRENKKSLVGAFALYEVFGFCFLITLALKNYCLRLLASLKQGRVALKTPITKLEIKEQTTKDLADTAAGILSSIGLTNNFGSFVVITGHRASTENNPYQAAYDCGACGGNGGVSNAQLACHLLNDANVRQHLDTKGIHIPEKTVFIAAVHNTTRNVIEWQCPGVALDTDQQQQLKTIKYQTKQAMRGLQKEQAATLPGDKNLARRSRSWAELLPELGLANNAAMIIAPRAMTKGLKLENRVFLHSYEAAQDLDNSILEGIFLGPVVVGHWINSQYYFSSVDPKQYGSGNKAIHNVLPNIGVMEGNQSDLKYGLPLQSVMYRDQRWHQPLRLTVYVAAAQEKIDAIIAKHEHLKQLVTGQWIHICQI